MWIWKRLVRGGLVGRLFGDVLFWLVDKVTRSIWICERLMDFCHEYTFDIH